MMVHRPAFAPREQKRELPTTIEAVQNATIVLLTVRPRGRSDLVAATGPNGRCPGLSWSMLVAPAGLASCNGYFHPSNGARMARRKYAQFASIPTRTLLLSSGSLLLP